MEREIETKCIHLEEDEASIQHFGSISYPIYQTATYAHPAQSTGFDYSRLQNPPENIWRWWHPSKTVWTRWRFPVVWQQLPC